MHDVARWVAVCGIAAVFGGGESETGQEGFPMAATGGQPPDNGDTPPSGMRKRGRGATRPAADKACNTMRISEPHAEWVSQFAKDNQLHQHVVVDEAVELLTHHEGSGANAQPNGPEEPSNEEHCPAAEQQLT
eukprot:jgi/Tetstr1/436072/TSEL_002666.t1